MFSNIIYPEPDTLNTTPIPLSLPLCFKFHSNLSTFLHFCHNHPGLSSYLSPELLQKLSLWSTWSTHISVSHSVLQLYWSFNFPKPHCCPLGPSNVLFLGKTMLHAINPPSHGLDNTCTSFRFQLKTSLPQITGFPDPPPHTPPPPPPKNRLVLSHSICISASQLVLKVKS